MNMKIAIVGAGISGLSAALILKDKYQVELFESENRLGGHAHTVTVKDNNQSAIPIDTGFLVYNELTYPHFTKMLQYLNVEAVDSDMTLSIQTAEGLQWAGTNLATVFAQKKNLLNLSFVKMLFEILKFNRQAPENLELAKKNNWSLQELIEHRKHSESFIKWYLLPMTGAIWSMSNEKCLEFPAQSFLQFCINHRLLQVENRPVWKTIKNGSINYVEAIEKQLPAVHKGCSIDRIEKLDGKLRLHYNSKFQDFDKIILCTSAPISHGLLQGRFPQWGSLLEHATTSKNKVVLHRDQTVMPTYKSCWSSWNVKAASSARDSSQVELTYYLNKLQPLKTKDRFFVTLNKEYGLKNIDQELIYHHPQFDKPMLEVQQKLADMQGQDGIFLAGAWTRYGFHEDGLLSAVNVAKALGADTPWVI